MTNILLSNGKYCYTRIQAIIWICDGSCNAHTLQEQHFKILFDVIRDINEPIVINCHSKVTFEENSLIVFLERMINVKNPICFINIPDIEASKTKRIIESNSTLKLNMDCSVNCLSGQNYQLTIVGKGKLNTLISISNIHENALNLEEEKIKQYISSSFKLFSKNSLLVSTAITANGDFDAFKFIEDPSSFMWIALKLSDLVDRLTKDSNSGEYRILAVSLRGSILAGAVASICGLSINTIDHLGPKYKVIDLEFKETLRDKKYIYIGDFVIGGTEIKIAQAYTKMFGGELNHAFAIGSMLSADGYSNSFTLETLYQLKNLVDVNYSIENN